MKTFNQTLNSNNFFTQIWKLFWPPILVFSLHIFLVRVINIYSYYPWLDMPMHYLGGLSMAYSLSLAGTALQERKTISRLDNSIELVLIFTGVITIAVFWEFGEFLLDHFLGTNLQVSLPNTMQDLLMGILGAGTIVVLKIYKALLKR